MQNDNPMLQALLDTFRARVGSSHTIVLSKDNHVIAVEGTEKVLDQATPAAAAILRGEVKPEYLKKAHKVEMEQFLRLSFGSNSKELREGYTVTYGGVETVAGQKTTRIVLVPKSEDMLAMFPKFELWISDATGISIQQKIYEQGGNYTVAT